MLHVTVLKHTGSRDLLWNIIAQVSEVIVEFTHITVYPGVQWNML